MTYHYRHTDPRLTPLKPEDTSDMDLDHVFKFGTSEGAEKAWEARRGADHGGEDARPKSTMSQGKEKPKKKGFFDSMMQSLAVGVLGDEMIAKSHKKDKKKWKRAGRMESMKPY